MATQKLIMNIDENLLAQVDDYASSLHINRTAAVAVLLSRALQNDEIARTMSKMVKLVEEEKGKTEIGLGN